MAETPTLRCPSCGNEQTPAALEPPVFICASCGASAVTTALGIRRATGVDLDPLDAGALARLRKAHATIARPGGKRAVG